MADTGLGIEAGEHPLIFKRFRQAWVPSTAGWASVSPSSVTSSRTPRTVTPASPGLRHGVTFTVGLPAAAVDPSSCRSPSSTEECRGGLQLTGVSIVLVDDDADSREFEVSLLTGRGSTVRACGAARERLGTRCSTSSQTSSSLDIGLPDEDGYSLLRRVRAREVDEGLPSVPAIAVTAFGCAEARRTPRPLARGLGSS